MRIMLLAAAAAVSIATAAVTPVLAADPLDGEWLVQNGEAKVRLGPCPGHADRLCGVVDWLRAPNDAAGGAKRDVNNPDPALKTRPIMGLTLIADFHRDQSGRWTGGKIYDPRSGKTYASKLGLNPDGTLKVEGCVAMFCQAQTWRRA